jgi:hypothetical protein
VGLLKRKNWARWLFIALLAVGVVYLLSCLLLDTRLVSRWLELPDVAAWRARTRAGRVVETVVSCALSVGFAWIIRRLLSAEIRKEFASRDRRRGRGESL